MTIPDRVAFEIFGRPIYWYGVLMALGIIAAVALAMLESKRKKLHEDTVLDLCLVLIPCGVVGARLYYVAFEWQSYMADPIRILYIWEGGLAIFGAIIGGLIGMAIYARRKKLRFLMLADIVAPGLVLAQAIGRWGNFFNQEAFGNPVTDPGLLWFPLTVKIEIAHTFNGELCTNPYHLATFFYESMWCLLVFFVLWFFLKKRVKHDGDVFLWYLMLYSFERMFVEGLRGDSLWLVQDVVRVSQLLSFLLFAGVALFFLVRHAKEKKLNRLIWPSPVAVVETPEEQALEEETALQEEAAVQEEVAVQEEAAVEEEAIVAAQEKAPEENEEETLE